MSEHRLINQGWEHLDRLPVRARVQPGYEDAPANVEGRLVVTEIMDLSGDENFGFTYTIDGWSVVPETIQRVEVS
tara:strand:- start:1306 stop:1530 length:225 start_codon:yes stop_codon:yes gene_type:complete